LILVASRFPDSGIRWLIRLFRNKNTCLLQIKPLSVPPNPSSIPTTTSKKVEFTNPISIQPGWVLSSGAAQ
jgi:hypothetical protein